jgi:hypothetical protein
MPRIGPPPVYKFLDRRRYLSTMYRDESNCHPLLRSSTQHASGHPMPSQANQQRLRPPASCAFTIHKTIFF